MRITQGTFSFLPDLSDDEIESQVRYCLQNGWAVSLEFTDDPHPRNVYWDMWGQPMFDQRDADAIMRELATCRATHPRKYIRLSGFDRRHGRQTTALSFVVNRPPREPGFRLDRQEDADRRIRYTLHAYSAERPAGERYGD